MKFLLLCAAAVLISLSVFAAKPKPDSKGEVVQLDPVRVSALPTNSFPLELEVRVSKEQRKVIAIVITGVQSDSEASRAGLLPGDEIVKINGRDVAGMDGRVNLEADLAKLLINRPAGEKIQLDILTKRTTSVTLHSGLNLNLDK